MSKKKNKTKVIYRNKPVSEFREGYFGKEKQEEVKEDIKKLKEQRDLTPKGFKGFIRKAAINKQINERSQILRQARQTELAKVQTSKVKSLVELEEQKLRLQGLRKANQVDFTGLGVNSEPRKSLRIEDLY